MPKFSVTLHVALTLQIGSNLLTNQNTALKLLLKRLEITFGISGNVLNRIRSYLSNRVQRVKTNGIFSSEIPVKFGVPKGSVLGPRLFTMYVYPLTDVFNENDLPYHSYADDNQLHPSSKVGQFEAMTHKISEGSDQIDSWMTTNKLKKNNDKTEMMVCGTNHKLKSTETNSAIIGGETILFSPKVKNLGIVIEGNLSMDSTVSFIRKCCYFELRKIAQLRPYINEQAAEKLVLSFVILRIDYCNSLFYNMSQENVQKLQVLQNNAVRLVKRVDKSKLSSASALLFALHWLPVKKIIVYKIAFLTYYCLYDKASPEYLKDLIVRYDPDY